MVLLAALEVEELRRQQSVVEVQRRTETGDARLELGDAFSQYC